MAKVKLEKVGKEFGNETAVNDVTTTIEHGKFVTLLGPSGCGKTTALRSIAGLEQITSGEISIGGEIISSPDNDIHVSPENRDIGMVFQSYALWPHMSVFDNIAYPLKVNDVDVDIENSVMDALETVDISDQADQYPPTLSGGQQQRVAFARAMVSDPDVMLLDEPLSNLDAELRKHMQSEVQKLHNELDLTIVYVTHNQSEAMAISDEIIVMNDGEFVQKDVPKDIYRQPKSEYVAQFIGETNILRGTIKSINGKYCTIQLSSPEFNGLREITASKPSNNEMNIGDHASVLIRPETVNIISNRSGNNNEFSAAVLVTKFRGSHTDVELRCENINQFSIKVDDQDISSGDVLEFTIKPKKIRVIPYNN